MSVIQPYFPVRRRAALLLLAAAACYLLGASACAASDLGLAQQQRLPNGMQVVLLEDRALPLVAVDLYLAGGSSAEPPGASGAAHCVEHLVFRSGSVGGALGAALERMGAQVDAVTTRDFTHYYLEIEPDHLAQALHLLARAVFDLRFDEAVFAREQRVMTVELGTSYNPQTRLEEILYREAFAGTGYATLAGGTASSIAALDSKRVLDFYNSYYSPERAVLALVGAIDAEEALALAGEAFAFRQPSLQPTAATRPSPTLPNTKVIEGPAPAQGTYLALGFAAPAADRVPEIAALDVLSSVLGNGATGLLCDTLVAPGLAEQAGVVFLTHRSPSLFWIWLKAKPENLDPAQDALLRLVQSLGMQVSSRQQVELAKQIASGAFEFVNATRSGKAATLGLYATIGRLNDAATYPRWVESVSPEDLRAVARRYLTLERCVLVRLR